MKITKPKTFYASCAACGTKASFDESENVAITSIFGYIGRCPTCEHGRLTIDSVSFSSPSLNFSYFLKRLFGLLDKRQKFDCSHETCLYCAEPSRYLHLVADSSGASYRKYFSCATCKNIFEQRQESFGTVFKTFKADENGIATVTSYP